MMKKFTQVFLLATALALSLIGTAQADAVYPYQNPTYIPTAFSSATTFTTTGDYAMSLSGISTVSIRVSGTCTSLVAAPQVSSDGTNYTTVSAVTEGSAPSSTFSITAAGVYRVNTAGYQSVRLHITTLAASCSVSMAGTQSATALSADPCSNPSIVKSSVAISQTSSTTANVVDAVTGKKVYVCGFNATAGGTNPTLTFKYGTKTTNDCDTGATSLSGAMSPSATIGTISFGAGGPSWMTAPASNQLCLTTAATTTVAGVLVYVQQ